MKRLSLAVALGYAQKDALARLFADCRRAGFGAAEEIVVAVPRSRGTTELERVVASEPHARLVTLDAGSSLLALWGAAMAECQGEYIAVLDGRDRLSPDWLNAFRALSEPQIVCGPVEPPGAANATTVAAYLSEYGQFQGPLENTRLEEYPGNNIVFPRTLLPDAGTLRREGFWKTFHVERLTREFGRLPIVVCDALEVRFDRHYELFGYLGRRYLHGRCYGGERLRRPKHPPRLVCFLATPALPALRTLRVVRRTWHKAGAAKRLLGAAVPLVLGEVAWSVGEAAGYALGPGDCCQRVS